MGKRRPLNDVREVTRNDRWANVARSFAYQPEKDIAIALFERVGQIGGRSTSIPEGHAGCPSRVPGDAGGRAVRSAKGWM